MALHFSGVHMKEMKAANHKLSVNNHVFSFVIYQRGWGTCYRGICPQGDSRWPSSLPSRVSSAASIIANAAQLCLNGWGVGGMLGWREQPPFLYAWLWDALLVIVPSAPWLCVCQCVFIVCLGSYQSLYPLVMRQDRSLCQHGQHIQPRMRNVSSGWKNCSTV